jgi:hypothetical protein
MHAIRFRHPLMRSAVRQSASLPQLRRIHEALAEVLRADTDRRVWHRAALIGGAHDDIASDLEAAAGRARQRGANAVASIALQRAAELSPPGHRARRLAIAAELAFELGRFDAVKPMLRELAQLDPGPRERARATWIEEVIYAPLPGDLGRIKALIAAADSAGETGDRDLQIDIIWLVASSAWSVAASPAL